MALHRSLVVGVWTLAMLSAVSCSTDQLTMLEPRTGGCVAASIAELGRDPQSYGGRRVCVSGFLGRMVPYGEDSAKLYSTREEAEATYADFYLMLGVEFDLRTQERLSHYSAQPVQVEGTFEFDPECWPPLGRTEPDYICFPQRPMSIVHPLLRFSDGARFR